MCRFNRSFLAIAVPLVVLILSACQPIALPSPVPEAAPSPESVYTASLHALQTGDIDAALDYYADDAVWNVIYYHADDPVFPPETYSGRDEIHAWWDDLAAQNFEIVTGIVEVEGDTVTDIALTWMDSLRALGVAPFVATEVLTIQEGKIQSATWTLSEESWAQLQAAIALEQNKALIGRAFEAFNVGDLDTLAELAAPDFVDHFSTPGQAPGVEGFLQSHAEIRAGFPDMECAIEDMIAEGDKITARITCRGTHDGVFAGVPPTGKSVTGEGIMIYRIEDGKMVERWAVLNDLSLMMQIGAIPPPGEGGE